MTIWCTKKTADPSAENSQALTDLFYQAHHDQLGQDDRMVDRPGPGALCLRAAITRAKGANVVGNTVTTIVPQARVPTTTSGTATDTQVLVGTATIEGEITDSMSGRRLSAVVDERGGREAPSGRGAECMEVAEAFQHWARDRRTRVSSPRQRPRFELGRRVFRGGRRGPRWPRLRLNFPYLAC